MEKPNKVKFKFLWHRIETTALQIDVIWLTQLDTIVKPDSYGISVKHHVEIKLIMSMVFL